MDQQHNVDPLFGSAKEVEEHSTVIETNRDMIRGNLSVGSPTPAPEDELRRAEEDHEAERRRIAAAAEENTTPTRPGTSELLDTNALDAGVEEVEGDEDDDFDDDDDDLGDLVGEDEVDDDDDLGPIRRAVNTVSDVVSGAVNTVREHIPGQSSAEEEPPTTPQQAEEGERKMSLDQRLGRPYGMMGSDG